MLQNVDLHFHSNCSDGEFSVKDVLEIVAGAGVKLAALTDHDSIKGVREAIELSEKTDLKIIPGIEISSMYEDGEVHVLGYGFDHEDPGFNEFLEKRFRDRTEKIVETVGKLNGLGYRITFEDVMEQSPGPFVGRPNVARALVSKGYIGSIREAFTKDLIGDNGAAYVAPKGLDASEAIDRIHAAGGWAVIAHPGLYKRIGKYGLDESDLVKMVDWGLDGIEAYHSQHNPSQAMYYRQIAQTHGLKVTVGSDYHYGVYPIELMDVPREVTFELLRNFL